VVRESGKYLIEDGRQRFTAAQFLDLKELPCIVESEETALGAEFDLNLFRRHLTSQQIKKYAHMKTEIEAQKRPVLIPEFEMLREVLPPETLKAISRWPAETQKRVYRSLPVKYVEDPKLVEEYEKKFGYLSSQLDLKTSELAQLQKMVEQYKRKNEEYEALKKTKKEKFTDARTEEARDRRGTEKNAKTVREQLNRITVAISEGNVQVY
jgi:ParB-like chromosome segregation protein Spo0J